MCKSVSYEDPEYANNRLSGTLVTDSERRGIYKVIGVRSLDRFEVAKLNQPNTKGPVWTGDITKRQEELSFMPFPLGNVLVNFDSLYLFRIANRRNYKQGLKSDIVGYYNRETGAQSLLSIEDNPSFLYMPLLQMYPSVSEAVRMSESGVYRLVPISRSFSVDGGRSLYYRYLKDPVGKVAVRTIILNENKFFKELLPLVRKEIINVPGSKYVKVR